jgi:hypothetical protein
MITSTQHRRAAFQAAMYTARHNRMERAAAYAAANSSPHGALTIHELADIFAASGSVGFVGSTWDAAHTDAGFTLSNGDHTVTMNVTGSTYTVGTRSKTVSGGGKKYLQFTFGNVSGTAAIGLADDTYNPPGGIQVAQSCIYVNNGFEGVFGNTTTIDTWTTGAVIDFAVDMTDSTNVRFFTRVNNGAWNGDPVAGTGGIVSGSKPSNTLRAALSMTDNGNSCTINTGNTAFTNTPPTGYTAWD